MEKPEICIKYGPDFPYYLGHFKIYRPDFGHRNKFFKPGITQKFLNVTAYKGRVDNNVSFEIIF